MKNKSLIKEHVAPIAHQTIGGILTVFLLGIGAAAISYLTARSALIQSMPPYKAIPLGVGVFFLISLSLYLLSLAVATIRQVKPESRKAQQSLIIKEPCPDQWLHDIAIDSRSSIWQYVRIEKISLSGHALLDTAPYIDFHIKLFNASVFRLSIDESIQGSVSLNQQEFSREVKARVGVSNWRYNNEAILIFRQPLSPEEAVLILNAMTDADELRLWHLRFTVRGYRPDLHVEPSQPSLLHEKIPCSVLREHYPKLDIEIQEHELETYVNLSDWSQHGGSYINVKVRFVNHRTIAVEIKNFILVIKATDKTHSVNAEAGDIYEGRHINEKNEERLTGNKLKNLNARSETFITVEQDIPFDGWLQFMLNDVMPSKLDGLTAKLVIRDMSREEHYAEWTLKYETDLALLLLPLYTQDSVSNIG